MGYQYTYLLMGICFLIFWLILFLWRKDIRKEMLISSIIFMFAGPLVNIVYTIDWWKPLTITNTRIGFEGFLVGFMIGGIGAVVYEEILMKKIRERKSIKKIKERRKIRFSIIALLTASLFFGSFYLLKLNSFLSTIIAFSIPILIIYIQRKDLIIDSLISGGLLLAIAFIVYTILELLTPGWVEAFWIFKNTPKIIFLNVPIDDIVWYFLAGAFIGPLYEYWQEGKLVDLK